MNNLIGKKFNRLTVLSEDFKRGNYRYFKCKCVCGTLITTRGASIKDGSCQSCGCYQREKASLLGKLKKTHGQSKDRFYKIWKGLFTRCYNQNCRSYKHYGGRGIKVCERWKKFENFQQDMINGYRDTLSIDRIDNDSDYNKLNCKWSTIQEQNSNKRMFKLTREKVSTIRSRYKYGLGKKLAEEYGVSCSVISEIINKKRNYSRI